MPQQCRSIILLLVQVSNKDYHDARQLLVAALEMRRKYMALSGQLYCTTTSKMLDDELPPSSTFCVPDVGQGLVRFTPAGDVIACKFVYVYSITCRNLINGPLSVQISEIPLHC